MKAEWKPWKYGWGETMTLGRGIEIEVSKSVSRDEQFQWRFAGYRSKPIIPSLEDAKRLGIGFAKKVLTEAIELLPK